MMVNLVPVMENKPMVLNKERTTVNRGKITPEILRNNRDSNNAIIRMEEMTNLGISSNIFCFRSLTITGDPPRSIGKSKFL